VNAEVTPEPVTGAVSLLMAEGSGSASVTPKPVVASVKFPPLGLIATMDYWTGFADLLFVAVAQVGPIEARGPPTLHTSDKAQAASLVGAVCGSD
jgi:hypothetical protein